MYLGLKIQIVDLMDVFNDYLFKFILDNRNRLRDVDNGQKPYYIGKYPTKSEIIQDVYDIITNHITSRNDFLTTYILCPEAKTPKVSKRIRNAVVINSNRIYKAFIKAVEELFVNRHLFADCVFQYYKDPAERDSIIEGYKRHFGKQLLEYRVSYIEYREINF